MLDKIGFGIVNLYRLFRPVLFLWALFCFESNFSLENSFDFLFHIHMCSYGEFIVSLLGFHYVNSNYYSTIEAVP